MATITINIEDKVAHEFREIVEQELGKRKRALGKATQEALIRWIHEKRQKDIAKEMLQLMEQGINLGGLKIKSRDELYDRR